MHDIIMSAENAMKLIELPKIYTWLNNIFMANEIYLNHHGRIYLWLWKESIRTPSKFIIPAALIYIYNYFSIYTLSDLGNSSNLIG